MSTAHLAPRQHAAARMGAGLDAGHAPRGARGIPAFALYGEAGTAPQRLHIETIRDRGLLYQWEIGPHLHHGLYQVVWVGQGGARVVLDERHEEVAGPAAIVVPPGVVHGFAFAPGTQGRVLTLDGRFLVEGELQAVGDALQELFAGPRVWLGEGDLTTVQRLEGLLQELAAEFASPGGADAPVARWLAQAVVWRLAQACAHSAQAGAGRRARHHQALFTRFALLVEAHHAQHWPVSRYAAKLGLSVPSLNRLSRRASGRSALELVHERLAREACRRLVHVAAPVAHIAAELGFDDPAYFCRFFKRRLGLSPSNWRGRHSG